MQEYALEEIKGCIKFIEEQTGEKFDRDAYFAAMKVYNRETEYELQKWEINKTKHPQLTGANFWLYRLYYFHLSGVFDDQARERDINFIWVQQDLMDCRTISRRDMREQVNKYMTSVLQEEPVDPTLVDFDDTQAW